MSIGASTKLVALLGHPVAHSLSPQMQNAAFAACWLDWAYVALDVPPELLEEALRGLGFRHFRVRYHQEIARIELAPEEFPLALAAELRQILSAKIRACGFRFVTLDLEGYRRGSLNETIGVGCRVPGAGDKTE